MAEDEGGRKEAERLEPCRRVPLVRTLIARKWAPAVIGVGFLVAVSLPMSLAGILTPPNPDHAGYLTYGRNLSWSLSILVLFPLAVGLTVTYYRAIPGLFRRLTVDFREQDRTRYRQFLGTADKVLNPPFLSVVFLLLTLALNAVYFSQALTNEPYGTWITNGELLKGMLGTPSGFSVAGLLSVVVQVALVYWMTHLVWNALVFAWALNRFFRKFGPRVPVRPLHEDGCCGLGRIGDVSMYFNSILFLMGLYLSLKVIDRIVVQDLPLMHDIGNPVLLGSYAVLAPILFFLPLAAPHRRMKGVKREFLRPLIEQYAAHVEAIRTGGEDRYEDLAKLDALMQSLRKRLPVWPFNVRSMKSFFGAVVTPVLPVALPFAVKAVVDMLRGVL